MPTLVTFYALPEPQVDTSSNKAPGEQTDVLALANETLDANGELSKVSSLAYDCVKKRMKTTILCNSQSQAEALDEFIWAYPTDKFIPHNLYGEGPEAGTPIEILWLASYESMTKLRNNAMVINLSQSFIEKHHSIHKLIDFVPANEELKAAARERYKRYKMAGCQLEYKNL